MDVVWNCRCCYSSDLIENLSGIELDVYSLICKRKGPEDDRTRIVACLQCREFLKDIHRFGIEHHGADKIVADKEQREIKIVKTAHNGTDKKLADDKSTENVQHRSKEEVIVCLTKPSWLINNPIMEDWGIIMNNLDATQKLYVKKGFNDLLHEAQLNRLNDDSIIKFISSSSRSQDQ